MKKYNHMVVVAFEVISAKKDPEEISQVEIFSGMLQRMHNLLENWEPDAFDFPDTYEMEVE